VSSRKSWVAAQPQTAAGQKLGVAPADPAQGEHGHADDQGRGPHQQMHADAGQGHAGGGGQGEEDQHQRQGDAVGNGVGGQVLERGGDGQGRKGADQDDLEDGRHLARTAFPGRIGSLA
jgi:hypothetical protein